MRADGTGLTPLTPAHIFAVEQTWSPDGRKIAFVGSRGEFPNYIDEMYMMNADGSGLRRLTRNADDSDPTWSPDGSWIAFVRGGSSGSIYVISSDGRGLRRLTRGKYDSSPAWQASLSSR
ncbi:MAG: hypothetical protein A2Y55_13720 [Actinobacteria bacterium RBG_16_68_12]|nr:MAG: hypothetical protein A2Y55_13720 [Actinobacteria bacterium RBG_16_68_12]